MYNVVTYDDKLLAEACKQLETFVIASGYKPDCILSIRRGGEYVGNDMFENIHHCSTFLQREGTKKKQKFLSTILPY